jgi:hypothetical protein
MTLNLNISTGVRLTINDDPTRVIEMNPNDVDFAQRFYDLLSAFEAKQEEYQARADALEAANDEDGYGLPLNLPDRISFAREVCDYMHGQIDALFGAGTAQTVFQGQHDLDAITQFFEGIAPFVQQARADKMKKYQRQAAR